MFKAFTLLELVIAMSIIAVLMGIGIVALLNYRSSVQLQSAYTDIVSSIKTLQNNANNSSSVTSGGNVIAPDFYALRFSNNAISPYYCQFSGGGGTLVSCSNYPSSGIVSFLDTDDVAVTSNCFGVGFARLSLDEVSLTDAAFGGSGTFNTAGSCQITLKHRMSNDTRVINFDLNLNKYDI